jgi:hypothetical protein
MRCQPDLSGREISGDGESETRGRLGIGPGGAGLGFPPDERGLDTAARCRPVGSVRNGPASGVYIDL